MRVKAFPKQFRPQICRCQKKTLQNVIEPTQAGAYTSHCSDKQRPDIACYRELYFVILCKRRTSYSYVNLRTKANVGEEIVGIVLQATEFFFSYQHFLESLFCSTPLVLADWQGSPPTPIVKGSLSTCTSRHSHLLVPSQHIHAGRETLLLRHERKVSFFFI